MLSLSRLYSILADQGPPFTLLGVGPLSRTVVDCAIECAAEQDAPLVFIASRNQIEDQRLGGGYVEGWDQEDFQYYVRRKVREHLPRGYIFVGRDHGGPWQKDHEYHDRLGWDAALENALVSYRRDIDAGFDYLHVDTSRDPHQQGMVPLDLAVDRIVQLMKQTEEYRIRAGRQHIDYEVSLEETNGTYSHVVEFDTFVGSLASQLEENGLPMPVFMVGNTGTLTRMDRNVGRLDFEVVSQLRGISEKYGFIFKEHNADYLGPEDLTLHPGAGIGMANVAPEFGKLETEALLELLRMEENVLGTGHSNGSHLGDLLLRHIRRSGKWKKWIHEVNDPDALFHDPEWCEKIVLVNGHYFFQREEIRDARRRLYGNCATMGICPDPVAVVKTNIRRGILRYFHTFNLRGLNSRIRDAVARN